MVSLKIGYKWSDIEGVMIHSISMAMQAILILCIVGMMVGIWILSGTIPTMIYYGLKLLSPSIFLIAAVLVCSITSLATGSSWGTMGTMGLALMGIANGMGMPIGPTAGATELTCILSNAIMPEQYISILVPGRMFAPAYRQAGIHPKSLSNALESAGTVTSCLIPWNTCGVCIATTLGISASTWIPWAVFNYTMPIVTLLLAFVGITATKMTPEEQKKADAGELV